MSQFAFVKLHAAFPILTFVRSGSAMMQLDTCYFFPHSWKIENTSNHTELVEQVCLQSSHVVSFCQKVCQSSLDELVLFVGVKQEVVKKCNELLCLQSSQVGSFCQQVCHQTSGGQIGIVNKCNDLSARNSFNLFSVHK